MTGRTASRLAWFLWALGIAGLAVALLLSLADGKGLDRSGITQELAFFAVGTVGLVVARHQQRNPLGWIYLGVWAAASVIFGAVSEYARWAALTHPNAPGAVFAAWLGNWLWVPVFVALITFPFLLFPDGHLPSRRWRHVAWSIVAIAVLWSVAFALEGHDYTDALNRPAPNPYAIRSLLPFFDAARHALGLAFIVLIGLSVASLVARFRGGDRELREQIKWLMYAGAVTTLWFALPLNHGSGGPVDMIQGFVLALTPIATGVAILKYRLYDIDVVVNKTIVYGVLAVSITVVYIAVVVGIGALVGKAGSSNVILSVAATAIVALAFQPARRRVQRLANRLVYGTRATPYEVLSEFADRLSDSYSVDDVLPRMTRLVAEGTGATDVRVWLRVGGGLRPAAFWPTDAPVPEPVRDLSAVPGRVFEVRHQGTPLGAISIAMPPSEPMSPEQERLVADVASQAGLVLRNVRLIEDLRASRQRLVMAQDEERRRLERNIHDGAQQQLVALAVKLRLAEQMADRDLAKTKGLLADLQRETNEALEDLRNLARGIYPPLLADKGLGAALEAQARKAAVPVTVESAGIGRFPQDVEATVYFCALEALNNVAKYARATRATVRLTNGADELRFIVEDDGAGFDPDVTGYGTGLQGMADRLAAVGGELRVRSAPGEGTVLTGTVPTGIAR